MIQRIQTIYLLLTAILMAVTAFSPILNVGDQTVFSFGIREAETIIKPTWGIVSVAGLSGILSLIAIFLFKNRKRQNFLTTVAGFLIVFFYITVGIYMMSYYSDFMTMFTSIDYGIILPLIALIFLLLAKNKIKKDEKLVRSLDRIR